jgi:branched-chain amino acid aminotransferase
MAIEQATATATSDVVFVDGEFVSAEEARVSVAAHALSYGTGVFEGIRATWSEDAQELFLLEPLAHYERLRQSAGALGLPLEQSPDELAAVTVELLRRARVRADTYVRPLLFLAGEVLPVRLHDVEARLAIYAAPFPAGYVPATGVRCIVSSWRRIPDECLPVRAKAVGGYVNMALAKTEALQAGCDEALMLTLGGDVAEATTANVLIRRGADWITPPVTDDILEGVTRREVIALIVAELGERVIERTVDRSELYVCDEALLCGTAAQIAPLVEVDHRPVGDGRPGERTRALMQAFAAIARGEDPRYADWTTPVYGGAA